jgi:hypothetical protein
MSSMIYDTKTTTCESVIVNEDRYTSSGVPAKIKSNSEKEILHNYDTPPRWSVSVNDVAGNYFKIKILCENENFKKK